MPSKYKFTKSLIFINWFFFSDAPYAVWTSKPNCAPQPLLDAPYPEPEIKALIRSLHPEVVVGQDQVQGPWIKGVLVAMLAAVMKITTFSPQTCQWMNTNVLIWWDTVWIFSVNSLLEHSFAHPTEYRFLIKYLIGFWSTKNKPFFRLEFQKLTLSKKKN